MVDVSSSVMLFPQAMAVSVSSKMVGSRVLWSMGGICVGFGCWVAIGFMGVVCSG